METSKEEAGGAPMEQPLPAATIWFMAISVGVIVANIYYAQPLLADIARSFRLDVTKAGGIAMLSQAGTALGMLLFVPLGDTREKRTLITWLLLGSAVSLILVATARNAVWLGLASLAVGMTGATVHIFVPFAAQLAPPRQRGRVVGSVLSGLLFGVLLARTFSGLLGAHFGWRAVYGLAAGMILLLALFVQFLLPRSQPTSNLSYLGLLRSIAGLVREHPALRESAFLGAMFFCAFSAFWTTLVFLLETPPYHYGSQAAGLFGLIGAAGAAGAPLVGRFTDQYGARKTIGLALVTVFLAYVLLGLTGRSLAGLIVGVILLDLGVQSGHVANQTRIYGLVPDARSRLNTFYMVCYFIGGAAGSLLGAWSWRLAGWTGVCGFALIGISLALVYFGVSSRSRS
ncbi:MAG TPA: MFS transporter [Thermoanaerobaculia bacterium]|nr:MFS transporter [Thermoanaerobaculia bacterium]